MDHKDFAKWTADVVEVTPQWVAMRLKKDDLFFGTFALRTDGYFEPAPPEEARRVLQDQASVARGLPVLALKWTEVDGWLTTELNGQAGKLRALDANSYELQINEKGHTALIFGGLLFAQKAVEDTLIRLGTRQPL